MASRTVAQEYYRFGFNGQERDDDVSGVGNTNTALFWEYDTRIGRRWNIDPKPVVWNSNYSVMADNPIIANDPLGDKFRISNSANSKKDIDSQVKEKYRKAIKYVVNNDTKETDVSIDFSVYKDDFKNADGTLNQKKYDNFVEKGMKDGGIQLIDKLANAKNSIGNDENYFYSADLYVEGLSRDTKIKVVRRHHINDVIDVKAGQYPQTNLSITPHTAAAPGDLPKAGYDGQVNIPPGTAYATQGGVPTIIVPRAEFVKHELNEIYLRTHDGLSYPEAHPKAGGAGNVDRFYVE